MTNTKRLRFVVKCKAKDLKAAIAKAYIELQEIHIRQLKLAIERIENENK